MIAKIKNLVFLWSVFIGFISGTAYYAVKYQAFIYSNPLEIAMFLLISLTTGYFAMRLQRLESQFKDGLRSLKIAQLKSDVDRFYKDHKNDKTLLEDDAAYLYMLRDQAITLGVNSFTQRKIDWLLSKDIA